MPQTIDDWPESFAVMPSFRCPTCQKGTLIPQDSKGKTIRARSGYVEHHMDIDPHPDHDSGYSADTLRCNSSRCEQVVLAVGEWNYREVEYELDEAEEYRSAWGYKQIFTPQFFLPPLNIIQMPENTPESVRSRLRRSFAAFWSDTLSSSAHARAAVESILDERGVPRTDSKGAFLTLHKRLLEFAVVESVASDRLMAIKWVGNGGAHGTVEVTRQRVLDVYNLLENVLHRLYDNYDAELTKLAQEINSKKG